MQRDAVLVRSDGSLRGGESQTVPTKSPEAAERALLGLSWQDGIIAACSGLGMCWGSRSHVLAAFPPQLGLLVQLAGSESWAVFGHQ